MENTLEKSIHSALSSIRPDTPGSVIDALARSVTRSISYDAQLSRLTQDEIVKAITGSCRSDRHDQVMTALREYVQKYRAAKEEFSRRNAASANEDMISWGFLLQCWYCFLEHGDVCCVRPLTISFLSKWLVKKGEYIGKDELDWCAHRAVEDAEEFPREEKERRMTASYEETVVLLVMKKFEKTSKTNTERFNNLIDTKRKEYVEYHVSQYGHEPDWSTGIYRRTPAASAFKKTVK